MPTDTIVLGLPSTLGILAQLEVLSKAVTTPPIPYRCPMYGSQFPPIDVVNIVGKSTTLDKYTTRWPLYSAHPPSSSIKEITFGELLRRTIVEIAHKPMQIKEVFDTVARDTLESDEIDAVLTLVGSTWDTSSMNDVFEQHS